MYIFSLSNWYLFKKKLSISIYPFFFLCASFIIVLVSVNNYNTYSKVNKKYLGTMEKKKIYITKIFKCDAQMK